MNDFNKEVYICYLHQISIINFYDIMIKTIINKK